MALGIGAWVILASFSLSGSSLSAIDVAFLVTTLTLVVIGTVAGKHLVRRARERIIENRRDLGELKKELSKLRSDESRHVYHAQRLAYDTNFKGTMAIQIAAVASERFGEREKPYALFVTSNGGGLGHVARCSAIADAGSHMFESGIASLSHAVHDVVVDQPLYSCRPKRPDEPWELWNLRFARELLVLVEELRPDVIAFDGPSMFTGVLSVALRHEIPLVWILRGLWKPSVDTRAAIMARRYCDAVIVPAEGSLASHEDVVPGGIDATIVSTLIGTDVDGFLSRADARRELGIGDKDVALLVSLGAASRRGQTERLRECVHQMASHQARLEVYILESPLDETSAADGGNIHRLVRYPIARYLRAFDYCISAAGYNSVHELRYAGVPTVFVPNPASQTDDQELRARLAAESPGFAFADGLEGVPDAFAKLRGQVGNGGYVPPVIEEKRDGPAEAAAIIDQVARGRSQGLPTRIGRH